MLRFQQVYQGHPGPPIAPWSEFGASPEGGEPDHPPGFLVLPGSKGPQGLRGLRP